MLLTEFVERGGHGTMMRLRDATRVPDRAAPGGVRKVSYKTIFRAGKKGHPITRYAEAFAVSEATKVVARDPDFPQLAGCECSVAEISDPEQFRRPRRGKRKKAA